MPALRTVKIKEKRDYVFWQQQKKPFLADPEFLKYKGFRACDEVENGIQLWYLPFSEKAHLPKFKECAKNPHIKEKRICSVLYQSMSVQCEICACNRRRLQKKNPYSFRQFICRVKEQAQNATTPVTTYALFLDGNYITNEQMNDKNF